MTELRGALLVGGTSSDAGKSLVVAGLCRALVREGVRVAPFKAQNMSNNSVVTLDGGEIGRAQALQATACGLAPSTRFNPVLLKPGSDRRSHVVVRGRPAGDVGARDYLTRRAELREVVADELASLRAEFDVVICEGAGSVAEINLRDSDIANMGLAEMGDLPVIVVGDIDRGGVLAHLLGTLASLGAADQARIAGFVVNKFRGDRSILEPGLEQLHALTGRPTIGVIPFSEPDLVNPLRGQYQNLMEPLFPQGSDLNRGLPAWPGASDVSARIPWKSLQPKDPRRLPPGAPDSRRYDFSALDRAIADAAAARGFALTVVTASGRDAVADAFERLHDQGIDGAVVLNEATALARGLDLPEGLAVVVVDAPPDGASATTGTWPSSTRSSPSPPAAR